MATPNERAFGEDMLDNILDWVANNMEPDEVYNPYDENRLTTWAERWAENNGYVADSDLNEWALSNGYVLGNV